MKKNILNISVGIVGIIVNVLALIYSLLYTVLSMYPLDEILYTYKTDNILDLGFSLMGAFMLHLIFVVGIYLAICLMKNQISIKIYLIVAITLFQFT